MHILIVDQHDAIRQFLQEVLSSSGYTTYAAASATEALSIAAREQVGLVVAEADLPDMTGEQLVTTLRAQTSPERHVPILLLTGRGSLQAMLCALDVGADDYLLKPFNSEELLVRIAAKLQVTN